MSATTINRDVPESSRQRKDCDCDKCRNEIFKHISGEFRWQVLVNWRLRCPECGAAIVPHFIGKHMSWHLDEGTIPHDVYDEWVKSPDVRHYRASVEGPTP